MPIGVAGPRPVHRAPDGEDGAGRPLGPLWPDLLSCRASRLLQHVRLPSARPESARPGAFRLRIGAGFSASDVRVLGRRSRLITALFGAVRWSTAIGFAIGRAPV